MEEQEIVQALAALAQPVRLQVFRALVVAGPAGLAAGALAEQLGVAPNTLSFHLKELLHAQLVTQERDGRFLIYRAAFDRMNGLLSYLTAHCCQGQVTCQVPEPCLTPEAGRCGC
jgi:DNA-binding transcriptional ArsR family regulator